jgi:hypothetical protein
MIVKGADKMRRKAFLFSVLLLILMAMSIVPAAAVGPPPTDEEYIVEFLGDDIRSDEILMMGRRARGGKHLDLIDTEWAFLTFPWDNVNDHEGHLILYINLKTNQVEMIYDFDWDPEGDPKIPSYSLQGTGGTYDAESGEIDFSGVQFTMYEVKLVPSKGKGNKGYGLEYEPVAYPELTFTVSIDE